MSMAIREVDSEGRGFDARRETPRRGASGTWGRNRRRAPRFAALGLASHVQTEHGSTPGLAVENISMGGLFVRTSAPSQVGTPLLLSLVRPGLKGPLQLSGIVVAVVTAIEARRRGTVAGMSVSLDPMTGDAAARLGELVDGLAAAGRAARRAAESRTRVFAEESKPSPAPIPPSAPASSASLESQQHRIAELENEVATLKRELLRRNRTIGDLAQKLAAAGGAS